MLTLQCALHWWAVVHKLNLLSLCQIIDERLNIWLSMFPWQMMRWVLHQILIPSYTITGLLSCSRRREASANLSPTRRLNSLAHVEFLNREGRLVWKDYISPLSLSVSMIPGSPGLCLSISRLFFAGLRHNSPTAFSLRDAATQSTDSEDTVLCLTLF